MVKITGINLSWALHHGMWFTNSSGIYSSFRICF